MDAETGIYQYRYRYYHAQLGRFVGRDPIRYEGGINLYGYVGSMPTRFGDPSGLGWFDFLDGPRRGEGWDDPNAYLDAIDRSGGTLTAGMGPRHITPQELQDLAETAELAASIATAGASDLYSAAAGETVFTGQRLTCGQRATAAALGFAGFLPFDELFKIGKFFKFGDDLAETRLLKLPARDPTLGPFDELGYTTADGRVFLNPTLSRAEQAHVLHHESVHVYFTPQSGLLVDVRQFIGHFAYDNSAFVQGLEEIIAETYATGSLGQGISHAFGGGYSTNLYPVNPITFGVEAAAYGGIIYGGYQYGSLFEAN